MKITSLTFLPGLSMAVPCLGKIFSRSGALLGLGMTALLGLSSCATQQPSAALGTTGTDIVNFPGRHIGERVTVTGKVNEVYNRGSFTVGPEGLLKVDLRVLARGPAKGVPRLRAGDRVRVEGVVQTFRRREFLAGYSSGFYGSGLGFYGSGPRFGMSPGFYGLGGGGLYPGYYSTWEEQPVIIAHRVSRL